MSETFPSRDQELRDQAIEFGLNGYIVGEILELANDGSVITFEQDFFEDTDDNSPKENQRSRDAFPPDRELRVGTRFSVKTYFDDIHPDPRSGRLGHRQSFSEVEVYSETNPEINSLHAIFFPVRSK
jgi:hypothetical protein